MATRQTLKTLRADWVNLVGPDHALLCTPVAVTPAAVTLEVSSLVGAQCRTLCQDIQRQLRAHFGRSFAQKIILTTAEKAKFSESEKEIRAQRNAVRVLKRQNQTAAVHKNVTRVMKQLAGKRYAISALLIDHWAAIVGERLASFSVPLRYRAGQTIGQYSTLDIKVDPAFIVEFEYSQTAILARINSTTGFRAVHRLRITPGKIDAVAEKNTPQLCESEQRASVEKFDDLPDTKLRQALIGLEKTRRLRKKFLNEPFGMTDLNTASSPPS